MDNRFIVKTLGQLEGFKTRLKEIHWSSPNMRIHELSDEFTSTVSSFEDNIAELAISLWGEVVPGELKVETPEDTDFLDLLQTVLGKAIEIKRECGKGGLMWTGIESSVDSFIADVQISIYKAKLEYKTL